MHGGRYSKRLRRSAKTLSGFRCCLFVAVLICMFVCLVVLIKFYRFLFSFYLIYNCSFNVHTNIEASSSQSTTKINLVPGFDQPPPF